jgi:hypothetical protein
MNEGPPQADSKPESNGNAAVVWLRFFVWLMPAALIPGLLLLVVGTFFVIQKLGIPSNFREVPNVVILLCIGFTVGTLALGYFDSKLKRQHEMISQDNDRSSDGWHMLKFFFVQLLLAPFLLFALAGILSMIAQVIRV